MNNINLVTGYWQGRNDRSEELYLDNFKNILKLSHNMTIFIPKKYNNFILDNRRNLLDKTDIIFTELTEIKTNYFKLYWDKVEKIRNNAIWYSSLDWIKAVPQGFSEWYNPIVMSKVFFIYKAYQLNKFNADTFIWIDAGITQHIPTSLISATAIENMGNIIDRVIFPSIPYIGTEVHGFNYNGFKKYTDIIPDWLCRATIFGCHKNYVEAFNNQYSYYLKDTLECGYLGTEESIFSLLSCIDPITYKRYHPSGTSMPDIFLKKMGKL